MAKEKFTGSDDEASPAALRVREIKLLREDAEPGTTYDRMRRRNKVCWINDLSDDEVIAVEEFQRSDTMAKYGMRFHIAGAISHVTGRDTKLHEQISNAAFDERVSELKSAGKMEVSEIRAEQKKGATTWLRGLYSRLIG